jgi:hypothetical protein
VRGVEPGESLTLISHLHAPPCRPGLCARCGPGAPADGATHLFRWCKGPRLSIFLCRTVMSSTLFTMLPPPRIGRVSGGVRATRAKAAEQGQWEVGQAVGT